MVRRLFQTGGNEGPAPIPEKYDYLFLPAVNTHAAMHTVQHISRCICKVSRAGSHLPGMQSSIRRTRQERVSNTIKYTCTCTEVPKQTPTCTHNRHWQLSFEVFLK
eukprot:scpid97090/ scgid16370/ 